MTQRHVQNGAVIPVTEVMAGPCVVVQVKTKEKDGYGAIQFGFGEKKHVSKAVAGHIRALPHVKEGRGYALLKEVRVDELPKDIARGDTVTVTSFAAGDSIEVTGWAKGRGFAGVVKRHHFHGHPPTHGHKDQERMPGSIGSGGVQHVFKGVRMGGRMGNQQVTVKNLEIVDVDEKKNILYVRGHLPGARNGFISLLANSGEMTFEKGEKKEPEVPEVAEQPSTAAPVSEEAPSPLSEERTDEQPIEEVSKQA